MTTATAIAFSSVDGGTIVVSVGPNGCVVSKNQRHIGRVEGEVFVLAGIEALPQRDVGMVRAAAKRARWLCQDIDTMSTSTRP